MYLTKHILVIQCLICTKSVASMLQCDVPVGGLDFRDILDKLPPSPPDLFPPLPRKIYLVGADATSLSFNSAEPCDEENCPAICWYFKEENDTSWNAYLQTSENRKSEAVRLMNLRWNTTYQVQSKPLTNIGTMEDIMNCPSPNNVSCAHLVQARTCEETVSGVQSLLVHMSDARADGELSFVLSWLPPRSACAALFEYEVATFTRQSPWAHDEESSASGGLFWSNATHTVTWPTRPCVDYPERHCHLLQAEFRRGQVLAFQVRVKRIQDGMLSNAARTNNFRVTSVQQTPEVPGPPRHLKCVAALPHSLELRWSLPQVPRGLIVSANIILRAAAGAFVRNVTACVRDQTPMTHKVNGLRPGTVFNVSVMFSSKHGIAGEPAYLVIKTPPENKENTDKPSTLIISSETQNPSPTAPNSVENVTTPSIPQITVVPTINNTLNAPGIDNGRNQIFVNRAIAPKTTNIPNTMMQPIARNISVPISLPKTCDPFNPSWWFISVLAIVLLAFSIASLAAGYCWGRQAAHSQNLRSRRSTFWGYCGVESEAYDAAGLGGRRRRPRTRMLLPCSFHEYEELNASSGCTRHRAARDAATLDSMASRSTDYSEYFFRGRLHRLPSAGYCGVTGPLLRTSYQCNAAFDPHEYEDVTNPPPYEVTKRENLLASSQCILQPLNPAELVDAQVTNGQGPPTPGVFQMPKERTF